MSDTYQIVEMSTQAKYLVEELVKHVCDDKELCRYCDQVAKEYSGTTYWTDEIMEQNENTAQYDLYWARYASVMSAITMTAGIRLMGSRH